MYEHTFEINGLPLLPNVIMRRHWWRVSRERTKWHLAVKIVLGRKLPPEPLKKAHISYTRFSARRPDKDGLIMSFKFIQDALTECGVIVDDNDDAITTEHAWEFASPKSGKILVQIRELAT